MEALKGKRAAPAFDASRVDLPRAEAAIRALLAALGIVAERDPELSQTPSLVAEAWSRELLAGYRVDPAELLRESIADAGSELVVVRDIPVSVMCPHHLLPATGTVSLAYAPSDRIVGLGALGKLVQAFGRRLVLQETLVQQIADALMEQLDARGAACAATLHPTCLTVRGARCHGARATSLASRGALRPGEPLHAAVAELLAAPGTSATALP